MAADQRKAFVSPPCLLRFSPSFQRLLWRKAAARAATHILCIVMLIFLHCKVQAGNLEIWDISGPAFHFRLLKARSNIQKEIQFALFIFAQHKFRLSLAGFCVDSQGPRLCSRTGSECTYYLLIYGVQFSSKLSACCQTDRSNPPSPLDLKLDRMRSRSFDVTSFLAQTDKSCVPV